MTDKTNPLEALMKQALDGDKRAYAEILQETSRFLRPFLAKRLSFTNEVDELLQEILLSIHKARHTYDGNRPYKPWVYAIAKFRLQDYLRAHYSDHLHHADELSEMENYLHETVAGCMDILRDAEICQYAFSSGGCCAAFRLQYRRNMAETLRGEQLDHACHRVALFAHGRFGYGWIVAGKSNAEVVTEPTLTAHRELPRVMPVSHIEEANLIAAAFFSLIHHHVGPFNKVGRPVFVIDEHHHPDA